jgi:hypothetical protein
MALLIADWLTGFCGEDPALLLLPPPLQLASRSAAEAAAPARDIDRLNLRI